MEKTPSFTVRPALAADVPLLRALIERSARGLSVGFYTQQQTEAITREVFGVDSQLVEDGTYLVVEAQGEIVACGGWGRRSTSFGGDQAKSAPERLLDAATEAAKIRAFFVEPAMARRGLGKLLMQHCAARAAAAGFSTLELVATMPGEPLYRALGFVVAERFDLVLGHGVRVPMARMRRAVALPMPIACTPQPPYYAVIFTSLRTEGDQGYGAMSEAMVASAAKQPGFLGVESAREEVGITVSYWASLEAISGWKRQTAHLAAQKSGRAQWYASYKVRICLVERDYAFSRL